MGRILEALNHVEKSNCLTPEPTSILPACAPVPEEMVEEETAAEVQFIEVGGPRKIIDASPAVLACAPPAPRIFPKAPSVTRAEPVAKTLTFQPLTPGLVFAPARPRLAPGLIAFHLPEHPLSERYRGLLAEMHGLGTAGRSQVVLFTAPESDTSSPTVLLNVAITAARQADLRVAVVDGCERRPALDGLLGLPATPGLCDVLTGAVSLSQALQETGVERLQALTVGKGSDDSRTTLNLAALPVVLRQLREAFALVLLNGSPALASACDAVFVVAPQEQAEKPPVLDLVQTLRQQGAPVRGCIFTTD